MSKHLLLIATRKAMKPIVYKAYVMVNNSHVMVNNSRVIVLL